MFKGLQSSPLLIGGAAQQGQASQGASLVLLSTQKIITPVSSVAFISQFSTSFDEYVLQATGLTISANSQLIVSFFINGQLDTFAHCNGQYITASATTVAGGQTNGGSNVTLGNISFNIGAFFDGEMKLFGFGNPNAQGAFSSIFTQRLNNMMLISSGNNNQPNATGIQLGVAGSFLNTGTFRLFGVRNS
jgi:hypothetical protein